MRTTRRSPGIAGWLAALPALASAHAATVAPPALQDAALCRQAASRAEAVHRIPDAFLDAIARVETGRPNGQTGELVAWPWSVNAEGVGSFYASKAEAIAAVRSLQARGIRSIDVGCLQVNLQQHAGAFASLEQAFDPQANADYAAGFLVSLFGQTGSWPRAAAAYHSLTPGIGSPYQARVLAEWAIPVQEARLVRHAHAAEPASPATPALPAPPESPVSPSATLARVAQAPSMPFPAAPGHFSAITPPAARPSGLMGRSLAAYRATPTRLAMRTPG